MINQVGNGRGAKSNVAWRFSAINAKDSRKVLDPATARNFEKSARGTAERVRSEPFTQEQFTAELPAGRIRPGYLIDVSGID